jgi:hypothetical protein
MTILTILNFMEQEENWIKYKAINLLFMKEKNKLILLGSKWPPLEGLDSSI